MTLTLLVGAFIFPAFASAATEQAETDLWQEEFSNDPTPLSIPEPPNTPFTPPLTVKSIGDQVNLSVETNTIISPYLGAAKKPLDTPENMGLHLGDLTANPLDNYHLETGVGLMFNELTEVNLGYRFNNSPSLLDNQGNKTSIQDNGDLRFSLEIKLPF